MLGGVEKATIREVVAAKVPFGAIKPLPVPRGGGWDWHTGRCGERERRLCIAERISLDAQVVCHGCQGRLGEERGPWGTGVQIKLALEGRGWWLSRQGCDQMGCSGSALLFRRVGTDLAGLVQRLR